MSNPQNQGLYPPPPEESSPMKPLESTYGGPAQNTNPYATPPNYQLAQPVPQQPLSAQAPYGASAYQQQYNQAPPQPYYPPPQQNVNVTPKGYQPPPGYQAPLMPRDSLNASLTGEYGYQQKPKKKHSKHKQSSAYTSEDEDALLICCAAALCCCLMADAATK